MVRSLHNLGYLNVTQNKTAEALPYFQRSTELATTLGLKSSIAVDLRSIALMELNLGHSAKAKWLIVKALDNYRETAAATSFGTAECHLMLGNIAMAQGKYSDSESEISDALKTEQNLPPDQVSTRDLINCQQRLEHLYTFYKLDPTKARVLLNQIIAQEEQLETKNSNDWNALGEALTDLSELNDATRTNQPSLPLSARAIAIAQRIGSSSDKLYAHALVIKAKAEWSQHSSSAEKAFLDALNANIACYGNNSPQVAQVFESLGQMYIQQKNFPQAENVLKQSVEILAKEDQVNSAALCKNALELLRQTYEAQKKYPEEDEIKKQLGLK